MRLGVLVSFVAIAISCEDSENDDGRTTCTLTSREQTDDGCVASGSCSAPAASNDKDVTATVEVDCIEAGEGLDCACHGADTLASPRAGFHLPDRRACSANGTFIEDNALELVTACADADYDALRCDPHDDCDACYCPADLPVCRRGCVECENGFETQAGQICAGGIGQDACDPEACALVEQPCDDQFSSPDFNRCLPGTCAGWETLGAADVDVALIFATEAALSCSRMELIAVTEAQAADLELDNGVGIETVAADWDGQGFLNGKVTHRFLAEVCDFDPTAARLTFPDGTKSNRACLRDAFEE